MLPVGRFSKTDAWIAGTWTDPGARFRVINPATGETIAEVADCGPEEARRAVEAAETAFRAWSGTSVYERSAVLWRLRDLMLEHREDLARLMSLEMGKPIKESRGEVVYAAGFVEWYAEEAKRIFGEIIPASTLEKRILIQAAPVGPVYGITPWNFPAAMVTRKLAPALAAGCSFILKPAEQSPLTALALAELLHEAGLPPGVFQVITTHDPAGVSQVILDDPRIRKLTFTGSTEVGSKLYAQAAATVKRVSLELGGHAPFLVFEDADLDKAVKEAVTCAFRNTGQTCVCANRIYVHEAVAGRFLEAFVEAVRGLKVGDPLDESTDIGPLVDQQGFDKVKAHVDDALRRGAKALLGGTPLAPGGRAGGYYFAPTVLAGVDAAMRVAREETFGPVAPVLTFASEEEAVRLANDTPYGLAAYVFTKDVSRVFRVTEALEYGIVGVNDGVPATPQAPFGGVKLSGVGREGGTYGIEEYIERKFVSIKL